MDEATTQPEDLDAQIAQRLFGWCCPGSESGVWRDPDGLVCDAQAFRRRLPAYSRVPAATALVWQWVETRGVGMDYVTFDYYPTPPQVRCDLLLYHADDFLTGQGGGATWPEALCRAALALAEALDKGEGL